MTFSYLIVHFSSVISELLSSQLIINDMIFVLFVFFFFPNGECPTRRSSGVNQVGGLSQNR